MKLNAMQKFRHFADWYDYKPLNNGTNEVTFEFVKTISLNLNADGDGVRVVILSLTPLRVGSQITTVVDRNLVEILPGATFRITSVMPNVDALGNKNGYRMRAAVANNPDFRNLPDTVNPGDI